ncbi:ferredoxin--NADP reductase [Actinomadura sp. WMMB 499]|uniref:ferredoxin--NADP reductase n=1 Tax=Actinomadura sp. WMMB 499 TaxID=1219491 RepID=UPI001247D48F|nr:ferredoxin--NADP reductase [Actinomadura sp. WMMB 499]QFG26101.1 ferredoxin--NADP reductase [Actinomadura sp. WMMB 499]
MARDHGFHPVRITRVVEETADARTFVLDAPWPYRAGQFVTFRACGALRSYSMSSSPDADGELMTTVKRVPGGLVSNWMLDNLAAGDVVEVTRPAGVFCLRDTSAPLVAFCGGSGVTPILSLVKSALATTRRRVRVLLANRDADAIIFRSVLAELGERHPDRLEVHHHLDVLSDFVTETQIRNFVNADTHADFYICGPAPFMDLTERALREHGAGADQIFVERFGSADASPAEQAEQHEQAEHDEQAEQGRAADDGASGDAAADGPREDGTVTIVLKGKKHAVPQHPGETLLQSARRAGLAPPFSCEAGNCATCIAQITAGEAKMRVNNALDDDEVAEGLILTCQGEPVSADITVVYED